jgi:hypothetical protein
MPAVIQGQGGDKEKKKEKITVIRLYEGGVL